jgi:hypothetical protein
LRRGDDGTMTAVHAVEIADRQHGAAQRAGVDLRARSARDMKGAGLRFRGFAQRLLLIFAASLLFRARLVALTVSARLTNFQINGLFKRRC